MITEAMPAWDRAITDLTIWGITPVELHNRFWASRGVQIVRPGQSSKIELQAETYLLLDPCLLTIFRLRTLVEQLSWIRQDLCWIRLRDKRPQGYRERAITDEEGNFQRFERLYGDSDSRQTRVALTSNVEVARLWRASQNFREGCQELRRQVPKLRRTTFSIRGRAYDTHVDSQVMGFMRDVVETWARPNLTIERPRKLFGRVWSDPGVEVNTDTTFIGPVWIGAGRNLDHAANVVGPAVLWDDPKERPALKSVHWDNIEPAQVLTKSIQIRKRSGFDEQTKRVIDVVFGTFALLLVLPLFPLIMLAIWLEDSRPFFFAHYRETKGGRVFPCLKFRSMYNDADNEKDNIAEQNEVDGPQFFVKNDPRVTRVGRFLRKYHLDEVPQFLNVIAGHMSLVGPRPSPYKENQYSPAWREARLSVRPGITGLWQVMRTRKKGCDFQEWIRYDIQYVERGNIFLDFWILLKTVGLYFRRQ